MKEERTEEIEVEAKSTCPKCDSEKFRRDTTFDKVTRWVALVLASLGVIAYSIGLVSELDHIALDFWEDDIVLGFCYSWLTAIGVLRSFKPSLPRAFHFASALANVLVGYVLVMVWVGLFFGWIDKGAGFIPVVMTVAYFFILRAIRIRDHFRPPIWLIAVVFFCTVLDLVIPELLAQRARGISELNRVSTIAGALHIVTILVWIAFMIVGFRRRAKEDSGIRDIRASGDPKVVPLLQKIQFEVSRLTKNHDRFVKSSLLHIIVVFLTLLIAAWITGVILVNPALFSGARVFGKISQGYMLLVSGMVLVTAMLTYLMGRYRLSSRLHVLFSLLFLLYALALVATYGVREDFYPLLLFFSTSVYLVKCLYDRRSLPRIISTLSIFYLNKWLRH